MSPDGPTKPLPEEKLLRLIRQKKSDPSPEGAAASAGPLPVHVVNVHLGGGTALRWPVLAGAGLGILLLIEAVWLVAQLMRPLPVVSLPAVEAPAEPPAWQPTELVEQMPSLAQSASEGLFASPTATAEGVFGDERRTARVDPSVATHQLAARLTLMGIVAGEPPQAIIEDTQTRKTYFVTRGQAIAEGAVVEQVFENRVILDLAGEKIELTL